MACRSTAEWWDGVSDQYATAHRSSSIGQARVKKRCAISSPQRALSASSESKITSERGARARSRTAASSGPGSPSGRPRPGVEDLSVGMGGSQTVDVALEPHEDDPVELLAAAEQGGHEGLQ